MQYTIENMEPMVYYDKKKRFIVNGYAFIDSFGGCIIIVYGENRRDFIAKCLSGNNVLGISYNIHQLDV